jgi:hypothetical protein
MTDKELLEFAAQGAGYKLKKWCDPSEDCEGFFIAYLPAPGRESEYPNYWSEEFWNPLIDDGDALRLAVILNIDFSRFSIETTDLNQYNSKLSAIRRGIVCAAAEIGKAM